MLVTKATFVLALLFLSLSCSVDCFGQVEGLRFNSFESKAENRTSLDLSADGDFRFKSDFHLSFDLKLPEHSNRLFGYVFRAIVNDTLNIDLLIKKETSSCKLIVVQNDSETSIVAEYPENALFQSWHNFNIYFNISKKEIALESDTLRLVHKGLNINYNDQIKFLFGANKSLDFSTTDVPPISLKQLKIYQGNELSYSWPFNEGIGNKAFDEINEKTANITNPKWLTEEHQSWTLEQSLTFPGIALPSYNQTDNLIYLVGNDSLAIIDASRNSVEYSNYSGDSYSYKMGDRSIYIEGQSRLLVYDFSHNNGFNEYDFSTKTWQGDYPGGKHTTEHTFHNNYFSQKTNDLFVIAGYGQHTFKNTIHTYNLDNETWSTFSPGFEEFFPRCLSGLASNPTGDSLYIIGGFGNSKGKQLLGPKTYYDVNLFIPEKNYIKPVSTLDLKGIEPSFGNTIVMDSLNNFYGLVFDKSRFNTHIKLAKWSLSNSQVEYLTDSIPVSFDGLRSFVDLYFSPIGKKLYAFTSYYDEEKNISEVAIHSLSFPPILVLPQKPFSEKNESSYWYIIGILVSFIAAFFFFRKSNKQKKKLEYEGTDDPKSMPVPNPTFQKVRDKNSILLFGGFQVFDKHGDEITGKITPLQKELFLIVLMTSLRHNKGISSERIDELFWFDKTKVKARNNRSVNISKINSVFQELDGCNFNLNNGSWMVDINHDSVYVDYFECLQLLNSNLATAENINRLTELIQGGSLLPNSNFEWLDDFKGDTSNRIIDVLLKYMDDEKVSKDYNLAVHLTNMVFTFDPINEDALGLQCQAFVKLGKHSLAEKTYKRFAKEYKVIYDEEYETSMNDLIKEGR
jgi:DNA-binding SARP family transcriptional activator